MYSLTPFHIDLNALGEGENSFTYKINGDYFEAIKAPEIQRGELEVSLTVYRVDDIFELHFHIHGVICIPCDICLDDMDQPIDAASKMVAKLGEDLSGDDDLVIIKDDEGILDISWYIYESIVLSIPIRHVHAPGKCNPVMIERLKGLSATRSSDGNSEKEIDPRWAALKKLKTKD